MGRFFTILVLAILIGGGIAWQFGLLSSVPNDHTRTEGGTGSTQSTADLAKLGEPLYAPQPPANPLVNQERRGPDPVVVGGTLTVIEKMDACSRTPGQLLFVGQEIPDGTAQVAGVAPLLQGKVNSALVNLGDMAYHTFYQRLAEGDIIGDNEMVALIDPAKAIHGILEKVTKLSAATAEENSAFEISKAAQRRFDLEVKLWRQGSASEKDREDAGLTAIKSKGDYEAKQGATKVAQIDVRSAKLNLTYHWVENKLPVKKSIVKTIYKRTGEAVKELEPILQLYAIDRLTAEGLVELQFANRLAFGKKVIIEPTVESSPVRVWRSHKKEVTAVAVAYSRANPGPWAASASADGTVCLWDERFQGPIGLLIHSQPVRSLACSPRNAEKHLLVAGLNNGAIAVWDLDTYKSSPDAKPMKVIEGQHGDAVTALAFSPDGQYFASGSADHSIVMWDTKSEASDFRLYPFDRDHGVVSPHTAPVTALHFTPQCTLVSAARDFTLRVWNLRKKGAALIGAPITDRSGTVNALGVSRDGGTMLFDQHKTLQFLMPDGRAVATLQNPAGTIPFNTLAEFSPDASLVLTAGAGEGRLQLWKAPTDGKRGFELRQFVTSEKSADVTSAAFFDPTTAGEIPYAVTGNKDGIVYLWSIPTPDDVKNHRIENVVLTQINQAVETRQIRIGAELSNRDGRLIPGQPLTIVIE